VEKIGKTIKRITLAALLLGVASLSLAACGGDAATATPPPAPTNTIAAVPPTANTGGGTVTEQQVDITLKEWAIEPANIEVNAGKVKFTVTNSGEFAHDVNFSIPELGDKAKVPPFKSSDGAQTLEVDLAPGTYTMICDIPGHADHGMKGTLVVK
jgi:uncharacterized cupredoxin-like copper-binding protein